MDSFILDVSAPNLSVTVRSLDASRWSASSYPHLDPSSSLAQIWMERRFHTNIGRRTRFLLCRDKLGDIHVFRSRHCFSMVPAEVSNCFPLLVIFPDLSP